MRRVAFQLMLPKVGIAWMFALLTINYNRVTIFDLGITALLVTLLLGIYPLFAPMQPLIGRWIDRRPLFGYRRSPYLVLGMLGSGLLFLLLPWIAIELHNGNPLAILLGIVVMAAFGFGIALIANTYLDLVAETTDEGSRGLVFAVAWTAQTGAILLWAYVFQQQMPFYSLALMQNLYNLTPLVCLVTTVIGVWGLEKRLDADAISQLRAAPIRAEVAGNPLDALRILQENVAARRFFAFVFLTITGIFLQDAVLEVYGASVLGMSLATTSTFQQVWNGTVLIAMLITNPLIAIISRKAKPVDDELPAYKRWIASIGAAIATLGLGMLAQAALRAESRSLYVALTLMGIGTGIFTAVSVTLMSDMTIEGATGRYLGLWSMAQAFATSFAFVASGALHTALIESGWLAPGQGFALIFALEGLAMLLCLLVLQTVSVARFRGAARQEMVRLVQLNRQMP